MTDNAPSSAPVVRRAPRWMWIVLILSLALNLLVLGAAAGAIWHFRQGHAFPYRGPDGLARYLRTLPTDRRDEIVALVEAEREKSRRLRRLSREKRRELARAFEADPLDADRLDLAAREASEARIALIRQRQEFFSTIAAKLTAAERRAYLEWRRERRRHGRHHRRWGHYEDDSNREGRD
jgi:uncharacterized membrane protein